MKKPKVLFFDIETSPCLAWVWKTGKQYIDYKQLKESQLFNIICICYKFEGDKKVGSLDWGYKEQNSSKMVEEFGKIAETADIIIGHNADRFDIRQINTQRLLNEQAPIAWPTSEDTLKQLRKYFYLPSYSLDYVSKLLTGSGKDKMEFQDWINIVERKDEKSFTKMIKYCKNDVLKLEEVFEQIKVYCKPKAHAGIIIGNGKHSCERCGSLRFRLDGMRYTARGSRQSYECMDCGKKWAD